MRQARPISRHYTLVLLTLMFIVAQVDRNIVNIFLEQMKADAMHSLRMAGTLKQDFSGVERLVGPESPDREDDRW